MKIVVLGAGPAGLGTAHQCSRLNLVNFEVYERAPRVGGLSSSFADQQGFTWDIGGHVLFSHYDYFDDVILKALGNNYFEHLRESWIRVQNIWVPYPFQNNIRYLPSPALNECLQGLKDSMTSHDEVSDFRSWMNSAFGSGIVKYFMEPYNKKVWGVTLESMSKDWIAERVSTVELSQIEENIAGKRDDVSWGPNNKFKFPKKGGTGAIYEAIAQPFMDRIHFSHNLASVDLQNKIIFFANGRTARYDFLISTIPLDQFLKKCASLPDVVKSAGAELAHNSGLIVGLGFSGKRKDPKCWMYFPEDNCPFYRVTNFHNYSPYNVPNGDIDNYFSLMCETSYSDFKTVNKEIIIDQTIAGLIASGMITKKESKNIISQYLIDIPYSYPVPTLTRDHALSVIQPYLESKKVFSRGRFGAWKYEVGNMDHSFMQGVEAVDRILFDKKEKTVNGKV
jgi:protoporphyrinogen oxidase